ncbi:MAG: alpha/beta hydrolase [Pseudomonadota bacterium]
MTNHFEKASSRLLTADDLAEFPSPEADFVYPYGSDPEQFAELRLPERDGPYPVMVLIHGGCWLAEYDLAHIRNLAKAFADTGIATWTLEYRRVGDVGGGWPGTFEDIIEGTVLLNSIRTKHNLDTEKLIACGHSAGGQLALWLASVPHEFRVDGFIQPRGILALAPAADLWYLHKIDICDGVVNKLMGGSPEEMPGRYAQGSPIQRQPLGIPQYVVIGAHDSTWKPVVHRYCWAARESNDDVVWIDANESGHFEMIDPRSNTWPLVRNAAFGLLDALGGK